MFRHIIGGQYNTKNGEGIASDGDLKKSPASRYVGNLLTQAGIGWCLSASLPSPLRPYVCLSVGIFNAKAPPTVTCSPPFFKQTFLQGLNMLFPLLPKLYVFLQVHFGKDITHYPPVIDCLSGMRWCVVLELWRLNDGF